MTETERTGQTAMLTHYMLADARGSVRRADNRLAIGITALCLGQELSPLQRSHRFLDGSICTFMHFHETVLENERI